MKQLSVSTFLETVERSGLVDKSRLDASLSDLERQAGASAISDSLVVSSHLRQSGLLTDWQSRQLLEGRHAGFFLGKYRLLDHLGTGGMSSVFLAEHEVMRRRVAIKVLPKTRVHDSSYLARFHREARAVAALDHPNIMRAFDVDHDGDIHYLVMEYIEGSDLKSLVEREGPLAYRTAADYIRQTAEGLGHAHQAGLIHRDMKPANLLVDLKGTVKILDMGLARFSDDIDASLTHDHDERMLGTVDFLSPEQALDSHLVDPRADIYSLGCTLYFALTGQPPFPVGTLAQRVIMHQSKEPAAIADKRPDAPAGLVAICRRMMAKSVGARYQSAEEVAQALSEWAKNYVEGAKQPVRPAKTFESGELTLAPLDDEPKRSLASGKPQPSSSSKIDTSIMARSDSTKVNRGESIKDRPAAASGVGHGSSLKPDGSSIKRPLGAPPGSSGIGKPGSSIKGPPVTSPAVTGSSPPSGSKVGKPSESSVKNPPGGKTTATSLPQKPVGASALDGPVKTQKPGSSIKGKGRGLPVAKPLPGDARRPATPAPAGNAPVGNALAATTQSRGVKSPDPLAADPFGPLDDLLTQMPPANAANLSLSAGGLSSGSLASGASLTPAGTKTAAGKHSRWESPWFLILVGTGLGLSIIGLAVLVRVLSG
ncbi:MAG TPA: protein kinase [Pirellulales bacterium]|nr:protein kinase [Pirellulales bacterium]